MSLSVRSVVVVVALGVVPGTWARPVRAAEQGAADGASGPARADPPPGGDVEQDLPDLPMPRGDLEPGREELPAPREVAPPVSPAPDVSAPRPKPEPPPPGRPVETPPRPPSEAPAPAARRDAREPEVVPARAGRLDRPATRPAPGTEPPGAVDSALDRSQPGSARAGLMLSLGLTAGLGLAGGLLVAAGNDNAVLGVLVLGATVVIAPSTGSFYTGHPGRAVGLTLARSGVAMLGGLMALQSGSDKTLLVWATVVVAMMVLDPVVSYLSDRAAERRAGGSSVAIAPVLMAPSATGATPAGLALVTTF